MALKAQLNRNLRKSILRGHPWIYKTALVGLPVVNTAELCKVLDNKKQFLAWAIFDPHSVLALRVLSTEQKPPTGSEFKSRLKKAFELRGGVKSDKTTAYRLINGEGDYLPGIVCDIYGHTAVVQFDGQGAYEFWKNYELFQWIRELVEVEFIVHKSRMLKKPEILFGMDKIVDGVTIYEHGAKFNVNVIDGQKTGFFLDQRENRKHIKDFCKDKTVVNLFSYTGGFSVYAGLGGARHVTSVDIAPGAIDEACKNWQINGLDPGKHLGVSEDVFHFLSSEDKKWDMVICDPPSMAHSEAQKKSAMNKYIEAFSLAAKKVNRGGDLILSSCSSHISFEDFNEIVIEALSAARRQGQVVRISGQGADHPYLHFSPEMRYLKFMHIRLRDESK